MTSIINRLLGRPAHAQPTQAHEGCCGGHGKHGHHAAPEGGDHAAGGCCGGHGHDDAVAPAAPEAPAEEADNRS
jgi:hypothetical protein